MYYLTIVWVRFVAFAGIISRRTSTGAAPRVGGYTQTTLSSSNPLPKKSTFSLPNCLSAVLAIWAKHRYWSQQRSYISHKRLTQQKKQRERERKELDALGRRQLANVRVVQRNVVYVVGIGPRFAKEEVGCHICDNFNIMTGYLFCQAYSDFALERVLWTVWQDYKDLVGQENSIRRWGSRGWTLHHLQPAGGCSACYCSCGWNRFSGWWPWCYESELWNDQVLHGVPSRCDLWRSWLHELARMGRWKRLLYKGGSDDAVGIFL